MWILFPASITNQPHMKHKFFLFLSLICTLAAAQATLFTYTYTGDPYTSSTNPDIPGLRLTDRITASFTMDDSLWGTELHNEFAVILFSGPIDGEYANRITTDLFGRITSWGISGDSSGIISASVGLEDGSGFDYMAGVRFTQGERLDEARVDYTPGSPSRWTMASVPDAGSSTLAMLGMALFALGTISRRPHHRPN